MLVERLERLASKDFWKDAGVTTAGQIAVLAIAFLINKVLSTKLGPADFTDYSLITKGASIAAYVMELCMGIALPKFLPSYAVEHDESREKACAFSSIILVSIAVIIMCSILLAYKPVVSKAVFSDSTHSDYVVLMCLFAARTAYTTYLYALMRGRNQFLRYSAYQVLVDCVGLIMVLLTNDLKSAVLLLSCSELFIACALLALTFFRSYRPMNIAVIDLVDQAKRLLSFGVPRIPGEVILFSFTSVPLMIINGKIGAHDTAAFTVSVGLLSVFTPLFRYIGMVLLPYASRSLASNKAEELNQMVKSFSIIYLVFSIASIIFMQIAPSLVVVLLYSREYLEFLSIIKTVIVSLAPMSLYLLLRNPIDAVSSFPVNTINLAVAFAVLLVGITVFESQSAFAWSFVAAYSVLGLLSMISWKVLMRGIDVHNEARK